MALIAVVGAYEGPWIMANGDFVAHAMVHGLSPTISIEIEFDNRNGGGRLVLHEGENRVEMQKWARYRVIKQAPSDDDVPTFVDFVFG